MTIRRDGLTIRLEGDCCLEDAEPLFNLLESSSTPTVDISGLGSLHTSVLQVLMVFRPAIVGSKGDEFFDAWILPALTTPMDGC
jgi:hypothetical protein